MTPEIRALKTTAVELGGPPAFQRSGSSLNDFFENVVQESDDSATLAAKCIVYFCLEDHSFNGFMLGVQLAVTFLNKIFGGPDDAVQRKQAYKDLKQLMEQDCTVDKLRRWAQSHF